MKKPNQNQAVYISAVLQSIAVGQFVWIGTPALDNVVNSQNLPNSMHHLLLAFFVYAMLTVLGYLVLSDKKTKKG